MGADDYLDLFREEPSHFDAEGFLQEFGRWRWCYLTGFQEIINTALLVRPLTNLSTLRNRARQNSEIAASYLEAGARPDFPGCEWNECDRTQESYAFRKGLLRFDKAYLLATSLEMMFAGAMGERSLPMVNVRKHLMLRPAVYVVRGLEEWQFLIKFPRRIDEEERRVLCRLKRELRPIPRKVAAKTPGEAPPERFNWNDSGGQFIARAIEGKAVTWRNALLLRDAFKELKAPVEIQLLPRRKITTLLQPNPHESPFVGLNIEQMNAMRSAFKLQKLSVG